MTEKSLVQTITEVTVPIEVLSPGPETVDSDAIKVNNVFTFLNMKYGLQKLRQWPGKSTIIVEYRAYSDFNWSEAKLLLQDRFPLVTHNKRKDKLIQLGKEDYAFVVLNQEDSKVIIGGLK